MLFLKQKVILYLISIIKDLLSLHTIRKHTIKIFYLNKLFKHKLSLINEIQEFLSYVKVVLVYLDICTTYLENNDIF